MGASRQPKKPEYSILVSSPNGGRRYSLGIRPWILRTVLVLLVVILAVIAIAAVLYGRIVADAAATKQEVAQLESQLSRLEGLQADIQRLDGMRREVLELTGATEPPPATTPESIGSRDSVLTSSDGEDSGLAEASPETAEVSESSNASMGLDGEGASDGDGTRSETSDAPVLARLLTSTPCDGRVTRGFAASRGGIDIGANVGTRVRAAGSGTVVRAERDQVLGLLVLVDHGEGVVTLYGRSSNVFVSAGDVVKAGQPIAEIGSAGLGSSPRLYFEVRRRGMSVDPGIVFPSLRMKRPRLEESGGNGEDRGEAVE
jgi:murein DD-endopeptidase MepM/ murein hydrolase activator NlpD